MSEFAFTTELLDAPTEQPKLEELVASSQQGDLDATVLAWERLQIPVQRAISQIERNPSRVEELSLTALEKIVTKGLMGNSYEDTGGSFMSWSLRVAQNTALDAGRSIVRHPTVADDILETQPAPDNVEEVAVTTASTGQANAFIAVADLGEREEAVVRLRILEAKPAAEVAAELGISEGNVASALHRSVAKLRRQAGVEPGKTRFQDVLSEPLIPTQESGR